MKILFVVPYAPNKIRVRPYNLIRYLRTLGNQVTLLTLYTDALDQSSIKELEGEGIEIFSYPLPAWRSLTNLLPGLLTHDPLQSYYCWQPQLEAKLYGLACGGAYDVIHIEHLRGARFGEALLRKNKTLKPGGQNRLPIIWDSVDCISYLFQQSAEKSDRLLSRLVTRFELLRTRRYEPRMTQLFDRTLVTSQLDKGAFSALLQNPSLDDKVTVLPNGVDLDYFQPSQDVAREPEGLVVSGKMSYHANVSMVIHLMNDIMPKVWDKKPEARLYIVGKDPPKVIQDFGSDPRVTVTGYVPDIRPYLRRATVALAPLTYGAGIQNKVLEAMACATPVVTTPKAISALSTRPGQDLYAEEDDHSFAEKVIALLDDPVLCKQMGQAGRLYVENGHNWLNIARKLERIYEQVILD